MLKNQENQGSDIGEKRINSPWNIAANFKIDMSFSYEANKRQGLVQGA
jgi:hypothetical protein